jgi:hypothetical protein
MNFLCCYSWPYAQDGNAEAKRFFNNLKTGTQNGKPCPFSCHNEFALVKNRPDNLYFVAVLVMRGSTTDDSLDTAGRLKDWFIACGNPGEPFYETYPAWGTVRQSLNRMDPVAYEIEERIVGGDEAAKSGTQGASPARAETDGPKRHRWWEFWK